MVLVLDMVLGLGMVPGLGAVLGSGTRPRLGITPQAFRLLLGVGSERALGVVMDLGMSLGVAVGARAHRG